ncbi:sulfatase-like hydrolase/transferase [Flavobacterium sp. CYK-4]|uniref:LTA synthase family protein n=1 Tax=Flavobacterium lotistagni TaxID=2709660 RepID=UPI00140924C9|nr:alkaline phosphatase family protein [Flavobacterium lotistagni]NHM06895.1 sulfatase-like hydrolase/transferase [Flavobacterium lotistagni]
MFPKKAAPFYLLASLFVFVNLVLRIVLIYHPITQSHFSLLELIDIIFRGLLSDLFIFIIVAAILGLYLLFISNDKYQKPQGYFWLALMIILWLYVASGLSIVDEYGGNLPELTSYFLALKAGLFAIMLFLPKQRASIRLWLYTMVVFLYVVLIIFNAVSEFFFWNEFGVRYNFIAVDYLIYTNEVIGNIVESYPIVPIFSVIFLVAALVTYLIVRLTKKELEHLHSIVSKLKMAAVFIVLLGVSLLLLPIISNSEKSTNVFASELRTNGLYKFYVAFQSNELDYFKFYKSIPELELSRAMQQRNLYSRQVQSSAPEQPKNIVLITVESLSAEFMAHYGNELQITPFLDSLAQKSLFFTNAYATGNRTVRGLEAATLCLPPTAGESVIKRKDNKNKFSTGYVLKKKGYQVKFLYGGDAYFDNMQDFYAGNGYEVVDKKSFRSDEISFSNVWGVCDEDMAKKAIKIMNAEAKTGKPFFNHWMTVSNHRPYTFPDGKIQIDDPTSRRGGVKYTDYALSRFFEMAQKQPWFEHTVFVLLPDHCASSAGKAELPLANYRIPVMIYNKNIAPKQCDQMISQIDVMPTLFSLLHFSYPTKFFGQDVFDPQYQPRAFIATYEDLGFIKNNLLTVLEPKKEVHQYRLRAVPNAKLTKNFQLQYEEQPLQKLNQVLVKETIIYYQGASTLLKQRRYQQ